MATARDRQEASLASEIFGFALALLGFRAAFEAFTFFKPLFEGVGNKATVQQYHESMNSLSVRNRGLAEDMAVDYIRLTRALMMGETFARPGERPKTSTLGEIRKDFEESVEKVVRLKPGRIPAEVVPMYRRARLDDVPANLPTVDSGRKIEEVKFDWPDDDVQSAEESEKILEDRTDDVIDILEARMKRRAERAKEEYEIASRKQAGIAQQNAMRPARDMLHAVAGGKSGIQGFVRLSRTGDPCHFCAMIMSRGLVLYKSAAVERGGAQRAESELYHNNCNCYSMPVYDKAQYLKDPKFALNRELHNLWQSSITGKYGGTDAINEWRKIIKAKRLKSRSQNKAVQDIAAA